MSISQNYRNFYLKKIAAPIIAAPARIVHRVV
jgi:hypothetical protein